MNEEIKQLEETIRNLDDEISHYCGECESRKGMREVAEEQLRDAWTAYHGLNSSAGYRLTPQWLEYNHSKQPNSLNVDSLAEDGVIGYIHAANSARIRLLFNQCITISIPIERLDLIEKA